MIDFDIGWEPTWIKCTVIGIDGKPCGVEETVSPCAKCRQRLDAERAAKEAAKLVGIPDDFLWARPGAPELEHRAKPIGMRPVDAVNAIVGFPGPMVTLIGSGSRIGKTSIACAALSTFPRGCFADCGDIARAARESPMGSVPALIRRAKSATLTVLDELGGTHYPRHLESEVFDVIWHRHRHALKTIITTGITMAEVIALGGAGAEGRLTEKGRSLIIRFGAPQAREQDPRQGQLGQVTSPSRGAS